MSDAQFAVGLILVMALLLFLVGIADVEDSPYQETAEEAGDE